MLPKRKNQRHVHCAELKRESYRSAHGGVRRLILTPAVTDLGGDVVYSADGMLSTWKSFGGGLQNHLVSRDSV